MPSVDDLEDWPTSQHPSETATRLTPSDHVPSLKIKIPSMAPSTRSSARVRADSNASGSEYHESNASMDVDEEQVVADKDQPEGPQPEYGHTKRGRKVVRKSYKESDVSEGDDPLLLDPDSAPPPKQEDNEGSEEDAAPYALRARPKRSKNLTDFVETDEEEDEDEDAAPGYKTRSKSRNGNGGGDPRTNGRNARITRRQTARPKASTSRPSRKRVTTRRTRVSADDEGYEDVPSSGSADADGSLDDAPRTSSDHELDGEADAEGEVDADAEVDQEQGQGSKGYALRKRDPGLSYAVPLLLEEPPSQPQKSRSTGYQPRGRNGAGKSKVPGWSATGAELGRFLGVPQAGDDSVCAVCHGLGKCTDGCFALRIPTFLRGRHGSNRLAQEAWAACSRGVLVAFLAISVQLARRLTSAKSGTQVSRIPLLCLHFG